MDNCQMASKNRFIDLEDQPHKALICINSMYE